MGDHVLVSGFSTRACAESAAKAGFAVTALDAFADLDQHPGVRAHSLGAAVNVRFSASAAARLARSYECEYVTYLSPFENHPASVRQIAAGRTLLGNAPEVLRQVRDPLTVARELGHEGCDVPRVLRMSPAEPLDIIQGETTWLLKPLRSGGGRGVRQWRAGAIVPKGCYLQQYVPGIAGSVVFVAAGGRAVPLGVSRQLVGETAFGSLGFRYCGSVLSAAPDTLYDRGVIDAAYLLAAAAARRFGLVGVNGIDFIAAGGKAFPIEINPRWPASLELVERASGVSMFLAHAAACTTGTLPSFSLRSLPEQPETLGKAIVFARHRVTVGDTKPWLDDNSVRDVPRGGTLISAGQPVCTVFASGRDHVACRKALIERAVRIYNQLEGWRFKAA